MFVKEIFNSSCWHSKDCKSFGLIKLNIFNWRRYGHLRIWGWDKSVKILEKFLTGDFKRQVSTDNFKWMIFGICISLLFFRCQLSTCMKLTFLSSLFDFFFIYIFGSLNLFIFLFLFFLILLNISSVLFFIDDTLFGLLWSTLICD